MNFVPVLWITIYAASVLGLALGLVHWRMRRRKTRFPLGQDVKLRRQPGEHLRQEIEKAEEELLTWMFALILAPLIGFLLPFGLASVLPASSLPFLGVSALGLGGAGLWWAVHWGLRLMARMQNLRLGWFGERAVADQLEVLKAKGDEVFHDVPCLGSSGPFNLDHVIVGNGRVIVVETKTRRKPEGDPNGHRVSYDGQRLIWPWGTSTEELDQVVSAADWLRKELKKQLNLDVTVRPALTIPGWYVNGGHPTAPVLVENHTRLPTYLMNRYPAELNAQQTDLVARHLRQLCTGLDYGAL